MRVDVIIALICVMFMIFGCTSTLPSQTNPGSGVQESTGGTGEQAGAGSAQMLSAKEGMDTASKKLPTDVKDAILVSISGVCGNDGKSQGWEYRFDSYARKKGFAVLLGLEPTLRDTAYSFQAGISGFKTDSGQAVSICRHGGECYLENRGGKAIWTVVDGTSSCEVDAMEGKIIEEGVSQ